ncbi:hypothetical protein Taro_038603 [Colocasia esculenta]|uniref:CRAL-TRIO domain-containing protein n=1 Tax=Colocasia esculenta TaxID=4460 RepID=A0A843WEC1_COLES|nr:hypothetical protein [Colocasia esculenta]
MCPTQSTHWMTHQFCSGCHTEFFRKMRSPGQITMLGFNIKRSMCLVLEVKDKLKTEHPDLPVGKNGRDDEDMILWFLKDRRFSVEDAVFKLTKAIKWRQEFSVSELTEESVRNLYETGKAYVHDFLDVQGRPVLVVVVSKHFPGVQDPKENEKLCVFLIEKALCKISTGRKEILTIIDLRGFCTENADISFLRFLGRREEMLERSR